MSIIKLSKTYLRVRKQSKTVYMKTACRQKLRQQISCLRLKQKAPRVGPLCWHCPTGEWGTNHSQLKDQSSPQLTRCMIQVPHCTCFSSQQRPPRMLFGPLPPKSELCSLHRTLLCMAVTSMALPGNAVVLGIQSKVTGSVPQPPRCLAFRARCRPNELNSKILSETLHLVTPKLPVFGKTLQKPELPPSKIIHCLQNTSRLREAKLRHRWMVCGAQDWHVWMHTEWTFLAGMGSLPRH